MIAHHDELHMIPPTGDAPILAAVHIRREELEREAARLAASGWTHAEIVSCRACVRPALPLAA